MYQHTIWSPVWIFFGKKTILVVLCSSSTECPGEWWKIWRSKVFNGCSEVCSLPAKVGDCWVTCVMSEYQRKRVGLQCVPAVLRELRMLWGWRDCEHGMFLEMFLACGLSITNLNIANWPFPQFPHPKSFRATSKECLLHAYLLHLESSKSCLGVGEVLIAVLQLRGQTPGLLCGGGQGPQHHKTISSTRNFCWSLRFLEHHF